MLESHSIQRDCYPAVATFSATQNQDMLVGCCNTQYGSEGSAFTMQEVAWLPEYFTGFEKTSPVCFYGLKALKELPDLQE